MSSTSAERSVDEWLAGVGFKFNPFAFLDAATDPYINAYLINNPAFALLWGDWPSLVLAPAGGGKTALRVQVSRACWAGSDIAHPFPISYVPALDEVGRFPSSKSGHLEAVLRVGAESLLASLFFRPHWWPSLSPEARRRIRGLLDCGLPAPLWSYMAQMEETRTLSCLTPGLGPAGVVLVQPDPTQWLPLCSAIISTEAEVISRDPRNRMILLLSVLTDVLGMSSVYLMVDGIDGFQETISEPKAASDLLGPLLAVTEDLASYRLRLKAFLPLEIVDEFTRAFPDLLSQIKHAEISWAAPSLAEIVRQRVYIATEGTFGSLDALCSPSLRDTETHLAKIVVPLPREILVLTTRMLWERASRMNGDTQIEMADLEAAASWYRQTQVIA